MGYILSGFGADEKKTLRMINRGVASGLDAELLIKDDALFEAKNIVNILDSDICGDVEFSFLVGESVLTKIDSFKKNMSYYLNFWNKRAILNIDTMSLESAIDLCKQLKNMPVKEILIDISNTDFEDVQKMYDITRLITETKKVKHSDQFKFLNVDLQTNFKLKHKHF